MRAKDATWPAVGDSPLDDARGRLRAGLDLLALRAPLLQPVEPLARVVDVVLVLEAPPGQGNERDEKMLAGRRQLVLHARRYARVDVALDETIALELAQRGAQHAPRDPVDLAEQLV